MSETQSLFDKLEKMPLQELLKLCALAIDENMEEKRLDMLMLLAESRLTKYRTLRRLGLNNE